MGGVLAAMGATAYLWLAVSGRGSFARVFPKQEVLRFLHLRFGDSLSEPALQTLLFLVRQPCLSHAKPSGVSFGRILTRALIGAFELGELNHWYQSIKAIVSNNSRWHSAGQKRLCKLWMAHSLAQGY